VNSNGQTHVSEKHKKLYNIWLDREIGILGCEKVACERSPLLLTILDLLGNIALTCKNDIQFSESNLGKILILESMKCKQKIKRLLFIYLYVLKSFINDK